jgi:peroxiredoxin
MDRKKTLFVAALAVLVAVGLRSGFGGPAPQQGAKAPGFSAKASDGKTYSLDELLRKGPVVLYFIKADCPVNADAVRHYNRIAESYKDGKGTFLGVINGEASVYRDWQRRFKAPFTVLYDPELKIIGSYGAERSPWIVALDKDGKVALTQKGFSQKELAKLNEHVARAFGKPVARISFRGAPDVPRFG